MSDRQIMRELARQYMEIANDPIQDRRREQWTRFHGMQDRQGRVYAMRFGVNELFSLEALQCEDPFFRTYEKELRAAIYHHGFGDDVITEPYLTMNCEYDPPLDLRWGVPCEMGERPDRVGAAKFDPHILDEADLDKLVMPSHHVDETKTRLNFDRLNEAIGDILPIDLNRGPCLLTWTGDISTDLCKLHGLENMLWSLYDQPEFLHKLIEFMAKGVEKVQREAEEAGDWSLSNTYNQSMPYAPEVKAPKANQYGAKRSELWCFFSSQEFTMVGADMFEEFMLRYQIPLMERFGLSAYGCCEDLTQKIPYLRKIKNLRRVGVSPFADVKQCAEQIGGDYIVSYRPNPATFIAKGIHEDYIRSELRKQLDILHRNGCYVEVEYKDVETVNHDPNAMGRLIQITREELDRAGY